MANEVSPSSPPTSEASKHPKFCSIPTKVPLPGPTFSNPQELVTFHVDSSTEKQTFIVHKEIATLYSPVLRATFNSDFLEGHTQSYTLEDVEAGVFRLMVQWLYGQKIEYYLTQAELDSLRATPLHTEEKKAVYRKMEERQRLLVRLWILADKLVIPMLQNLASDELEIIDQHNIIAWHCLNSVYENTVAGSILRRLMRHFFRKISSVSMMAHEKDIPTRFALEVLAWGPSKDGPTTKDGSTMNRRAFRKKIHVDEGGEDRSSGVCEKLEDEAL